MNGHGTYTWMNGNKYTGNFKNDYFHGDGQYFIQQDETIFIGQWKENKLSGKIKLIINNGPEY